MSMKMASDTMFGGVLYMFLVAVVLVSSAKGVAVVLVCSANSKSSMLLLVKDHALTPRKRVNFIQWHLNVSHAATFSVTSQIDCAFSIV